MYPTSKVTRYICLPIDVGSAFIIAKAMKSVGKASTVKCITTRIIKVFGGPELQISGSAFHFLADFVQALLDACDNNHKRTAPCRSKQNRKAERGNQDFGRILSTFTSEYQSDWVEHIDDLVRAMNTANTAHFTENTAHFLMLGCQAREVVHNLMLKLDDLDALPLPMYMRTCLNVKQSKGSPDRIVESCPSSIECSGTARCQRKIAPV